MEWTVWTEKRSLPVDAFSWTIAQLTDYFSSVTDKAKNATMILYFREEALRNTKKNWQITFQPGFKIELKSSDFWSSLIKQWLCKPKKCMAWLWPEILTARRESRRRFNLTQRSIAGQIQHCLLSTFMYHHCLVLYGPFVYKHMSPKFFFGNFGRILTRKV